MKPDIIAWIENETGTQLTRVTWPKNLADTMRNKHNHSYVLEDGKLVALNVSATESLTRIEFDEAACAHLRYLNLSGNNHLTTVSFPGPMPRLKYLDLSACKLEKLVLPAGCDRLEKAWLQKNELSEVSFAGPCLGLQLLDLSNNRMQQLSLSAGFDSLAWLYLVNCQLRALRFEHHPGDNRGPEELRFITPLPQLETLHL